MPLDNILNEYNYDYRDNYDYKQSEVQSISNLLKDRLSKKNVFKRFINYFKNNNKYLLLKHNEVKNKKSRLFLDIMEKKMNKMDFNRFKYLLIAYGYRIKDIYNSKNRYFFNCTFKDRLRFTKVEIEMLLDEMINIFKDFNVIFTFDKKKDADYLIKKMESFCTTEWGIDNASVTIINIIINAYKRSIAQENIL